MFMDVFLKKLGGKAGVCIDFFSSVSSTNDVLRDGRYTHGDVAVAEDQTKGRGQRGNTWESEPGMNLTFSLKLEPSFLPADMQFLLSEAVALAVADTLSGYGLEASVKWTNDIYIGDRKVAGILIENDIMGSRLSGSIVGVGLNVNQQSFGGDIPNPVSMGMAAGHGFDRTEVLGNLYAALMGRYGQLEEGLTQIIEKDYHDRLYLSGRSHRFRLPDGTYIDGTIRYVKPTGELMVEHPGNIVKGYLFREIEFR